MACVGTESSLSECSNAGLGHHDCTHYEDAGVICTSKLKRRMDEWTNEWTNGWMDGWTDR